MGELCLDDLAQHPGVLQREQSQPGQLIWERVGEVADEANELCHGVTKVTTRAKSSINILAKRFIYPA
jgi:hypothetical protein